MNADARTEVPTVIALPDRWPSEIPLLLLTVLAALAIWGLFVISIIGIVYGALIALMLFLGHLMFVAHLRGSAVRLADDQLPDLYHRVRVLAARAGLARTPEVYLLQSGGDLNALATRFLGSSIVVLYSSLLEACGDDEAARDTVIAHELAHLRAGHLRLRWLLAPALVTPFPGLAYSRACELTCDRWAAALTGDRDGALRGITVLAAGGVFARQVDVAGFARQKRDLDTGWMTLGSWLSTHPPLCRRLEALDRELTASLPRSLRGVTRAVMILGLVFLLPLAGVGLLASRAVSALNELVAQAESDLAGSDWSEPESPDHDPAPDAAGFGRAEEDLDELVAVIEEFRRRNGVLPPDGASLAAAWRVLRPDAAEPLDPCDGASYGYTTTHDGGYRLWSCGRDEISGSADDLVRVSFPPSVELRCRDGLDDLARFVRDFRDRNGAAPPDVDTLYALRSTLSEEGLAPLDPYASFGGGQFDYEISADGCRLSSCGPDGIRDSADDVVASCD